MKQIDLRNHGRLGVGGSSGVRILSGFTSTVLLTAIVCFLALGPRGAFGDCCQCAYDDGTTVANYCEGNDTTNCNNGPPTNCGPLIAGGSCSPSNNVPDSVCNPPATPTATPTATTTPTPTPTTTPTPGGLGFACISSTECASTFCVDGVCCNGPCSNAGQSCNQPGSAGFCRPEFSPVPAASHRGLLSLTVLLAVLGVGSLYSVRRRRRS